MNTKLYQIYDNKAGSVMGPIIAIRSEKAAIRIYTDGLKDEKSVLCKHPEDYDLLELGNQDEETGAINSEIRVILTGKAWLDSTTTEGTN